MVQTNRDSYIAKVVWGSFLFSQFLYGFVLHSQVSKVDPGDTVEGNLMMTITLGAVAMILVLGAIFFPRFLINASRKKIQEKLGMTSLQNGKPADLFQYFFAPFIIRLALLEGVSVLGFVLGFMNQDMQFFYPFLSVSLVGFFLNFPSDEKIKSFFKA